MINQIVLLLGNIAERYDNRVSKIECGQGVFILLFYFSLTFFPCLLPNSISAVCTQSTRIPYYITLNLLPVPLYVKPFSMASQYLREMKDRFIHFVIIFDRDIRSVFIYKKVAFAYLIKLDRLHASAFLFPSGNWHMNVVIRVSIAKKKTTETAAFKCLYNKRISSLG